MAKRKNPSRVNIPMCAAGVLLCLTLFSLHLTSGLYAKYISTATGSDSARVAKFEVVSAKHNDDPVVIKSDGTNTNNPYRFTITNNSEVAVQYKLSLKDALPGGVTHTFTPQTGTLDPVGGANTTVECTLTFSISDWAEFTADTTGDPLYGFGSMTKNFDFTIIAHVEQID